MAFLIRGIDRATGVDREISVVASSDIEAERIANEHGLAVAHVFLIEQPPIRTIESISERPSSVSSFGVVAFALAVVAFVMCWIPLVAILSLVTGGMAILFAVVGLFSAGTRRGLAFPIAALPLAGIALYLAGSQVLAIARFQNALRTAFGEVAVKGAQGVAAEDKILKADPTGSVRAGDVDVRISKVELGRAKLQRTFSGAAGETSNTYLIVHLSIQNASETKKIDYRSWGDSAFAISSDIKIEDEHGNRYQQQPTRTGATEVVGSVGALESIYPGKSVSDILLFEPPVDAARRLTLTLPAANVGAPGYTIRLIINPKKQSP